MWQSRIANGRPPLLASFLVLYQMNADGRGLPFAYARVWQVRGRNVCEEGVDSWSTSSLERRLDW